MSVVWNCCSSSVTSHLETGVEETPRKLHSSAITHTSESVKYSDVIMLRCACKLICWAFLCRNASEFYLGGSEFAFRPGHYLFDGIIPDKCLANASNKAIGAALQIFSDSLLTLLL